MSLFGKYGINAINAEAEFLRIRQNDPVFLYLHPNKCQVFLESSTVNT